jgi:hypothetical protein
MQCNAMQYNVMQCNAMQCNKCNACIIMHAMHNAMYVMKSVRPYGMKSVILFFFFHFFKIQKWQNLVEARFRTQDLSMEIWIRRTDVEWSHFTSLKWKYQCKMSVCNECGWTDKFLFQFSFSSVAYSQVSLSVRTEVRSQKKRYGQTQTNKQKHRSDR